MKAIALLLVVVSLSSCDIGTSLYVNDKPCITLQGDCGTIEITGSTLATERIKLKFDGDFIVNLDSLKVLYNWHEVPDLYLNYLHNDKQVSYQERCIHIEGKDNLHILMRHIVSLNYLKTGTIEILPSNFILCNGEPMIADTIRFSFPPKSKRKKKDSTL